MTVFIYQKNDHRQPQVELEPNFGSAQFICTTQKPIIDEHPDHGFMIDHKAIMQNKCTLTL